MQAMRAVFCDPTHVAPAVGMWISVIVSMPVGLGSGQWTCVLPIAAVQSALHAVLAVLCSRYGKCVPATRTRRSMIIPGGRDSAVLPSYSWRNPYIQRTMLLNIFTNATHLRKSLNVVEYCTFGKGCPGLPFLGTSELIPNSSQETVQWTMCQV